MSPFNQESNRKEMAHFNDWEEFNKETVLKNMDKVEGSQNRMLKQLRASKSKQSQFPLSLRGNLREQLPKAARAACRSALRAVASKRENKRLQIRKENKWTWWDFLELGCRNFRWSHPNKNELEKLQNSLKKKKKKKKKTYQETKQMNRWKQTTTTKINSQIQRTDWWLPERNGVGKWAKRVTSINCMMMDGN